MASIEKDVFKPGECIPSCRDLSKSFNVTVVTVCKAIELLKKEGVLETVQGRGTFVSHVKSRKNSDDGVIGLFGSTTGHLFGPMFGAIMRSLQDRKIVMVESDLPRAEKEAQLHKILKSRPSALIIDGDVKFPFDKLYFASGQVETVTFYLRFETAIHFPNANTVLPDFEEGGRLAASVMLGKGRKKLIFRTYRYPGSPDDSPMGPKLSYHWSVWNGICKALREAGMDPQKHLAVSTKMDSPAVLSSADGVICMGDYLAKEIYEFAGKTGRRVGDDLGIVGFYNTPWATVFSPSLTSVSIKEDEIAEQAVSTVEKKQKGLGILIKPELAIRGSE